MIIQEQMSIQKKLEILTDAAKYDVACTSSGIDRKGSAGGMGNTLAAGICHSFSADGRCISLLKILFTNECIFDCKYCLNRSSNDVVRASFTPEEVCTLTMEFYRRNYIEGLFLSSGILVNPNHTMELICKTLRMLREEYHFNGYIHCKAVPGAAPSVIEMTGWYADRMSINLELPTAEGLKKLAPHKNRKTILNPMKQIQMGRREAEQGLYLENTKSRRVLTSEGEKSILPGGKSMLPEGKILPEGKSMLTGGKDMLPEEVDQLTGGSDVLSKGKDMFAGGNDSFLKGNDILSESMLSDGRNMSPGGTILSPREKILLPEGNIYTERNTLIERPSLNSFGLVKPPSINRGFVPAGQSTQMIIGATPESDYQIISVAEALYQKFDLKRVFYSAFVRVNEDSSLPVLPEGPPLLREHRLYQADWLLRFYGFQANELLSEERPNFNVLLDPKCNWALGHLDLFPVEVNKADYYTLLRVPGIGVKSAQRIVKARKSACLRFEDLKKIGVVLKRALYFISCGGQMMYPVKIEENYITNHLLTVGERLPLGIGGNDAFRQLSLFDDVNFQKYNLEDRMYENQKNLLMRG